LHRLSHLCIELLSVDPQSSPGTLGTLERLQNIRNKIFTTASMSDEETFHPSDNALGTGRLSYNTAMQPAYRLHTFRTTNIAPNTQLHQELMMYLDTRDSTSSLSRSSSPCGRLVLFPSSETATAPRGDFPPSDSRHCQTPRPVVIPLRPQVSSVLSRGAVAVFTGGEGDFSSRLC